MKRRAVLQSLVAFPLAGALGAARLSDSRPPLRQRVRPGDRRWPSAAQWQQLRQKVGGRLLEVSSPFLSCERNAHDAACEHAVRYLHNPYYLRDQAGLTQSSGYAHAWRSVPSAYAVRARGAADVAAAVEFARRHDLMPVIKGGGHSYQGTSNAPDSLLIWTRDMDDIVLHESFVAAGCAHEEPRPAVTLGAGAVWMDAYHAVTTQAGRYVQGGGCATVGVAGLVQSGGFGSFSKRYGTAAASLLQAEVITADGRVRVVNACRDPDLFWALKGGGGGTFGVVTRVTLRMHELPAVGGGVSATIQASSDAAFKRLIERFVAFAGDSLISPHWGETVHFKQGRRFAISMVSQGLSEERMNAVWSPFFAWVKSSPREFHFTSPPRMLAVPGRHWWDFAFWNRTVPGLMTRDERPGAPAWHAWWTGDGEQTGQFLYGFASLWLPRALLEGQRRTRLVEALFEGSRTWQVSLHFNKGLAGAPRDAVDAARDTATNPAVLDAFALAILGGAGPPAFAGLPGAAPDLHRADRDAAALGRSMAALREVAPRGGSYVSESDFFERDWQRSFWGEHYPRLLAIKRTYDPSGLFFVHHGVGSEHWSADGFTRLRHS